MAQILRYGAARLDATDDLNGLLRQMEAEPAFFRRVLSAAMEEDITDRKKRLQHDAGGRPKEAEVYYPIVHAAAEVFQEVTGEPLGRSTSSATVSGARSSGSDFLKRLFAPFPPALQR